MAIVGYLLKLQPENLPPLQRLHLDDLQTKVRGNIYLEVPLTEGGFCILSPSLRPIQSQPDDRVGAMVQECVHTLEYLKDRLMQALILETAILETSTYFIEQNNCLLLARLKSLNTEQGSLEVKLYTATESDLNKHYSDKIYIGRCFINLEESQLPYNGLNLYVLSLMDQFEVVKSKSDLLNDLGKYKDTYFVEIQELISDVVSEVISDLDSIPADLHPEKGLLEDAMKIKACYRRITYLFVELLDEVGEWESVLRFDGEDKFARYVTKYRQDLKNIINHLNFNALFPLASRIRLGK